MIDALVVGPAADTRNLNGRLIVQAPLEAADIKYRHDRQLLHIALEQALQTIN